MAIFASMGMSDSGTNLIKNIFLELFKYRKHYVYKYFGLNHPHVKVVDGEFAGYTTECIDRVGAWPFNSAKAIFFVYRNGFDRRASAKVRELFGEGKAFAPGKPANLDDRKKEVAQVIINCLRDTKDLTIERNVYEHVLLHKNRLEAQCKSLNIPFEPIQYEEVYENFEAVFTRLEKYGVNVKDKDKIDINKKLSVNNLYHVVRNGQSREHNLLNNHISTSKGEPYYWIRYINFESIWAELPEENKENFLVMTKDHPHVNYPEFLMSR